MRVNEKTYYINNISIQKELTTNLFYGFYESIFCNSDMFLDMEYELEYELKEDFKIKELEVEYDFINYNEYKMEVSELFIKYYLEKINDLIPSAIKENEKYILKLEEFELWSPKYYNYSTDTIYYNIKTNYKTLELIKNYTLKLEGAREYIKKHFSSYDGYISFLPNNIYIWRDLPITEYKENMISALFDMLIYLNDSECVFNLNSAVYEDIYVYESVEPIVYIKDKESNKKAVEKLKKLCYKIA